MNSPLSKILIGLVVAVLLILGVVIIYYEFGEDDSQQNCESLTQQYSELGVNTADINCNDEQNVEEIRITLESREQELRSQVDELRSSIDQVQADLQNLGVEYIDAPASQVNLDTYSQELDDYLEQLRSTLDNNIGVIGSATAEFQALIIQYDEQLDLSEEKTYLDNYLALDQSEQINQFMNFMDRLQNLREQIESETGAPPQDQPENEPEDQPATGLREFNSSEFVDLYKANIPLPNTYVIDFRPEITGDVEADVRILNLAEEEGFMLQPVPGDVNLVFVDNTSLQPAAANAWEAMQAAASRDGETLIMGSGFRSIEAQRDVFLNRFRDASRDDIGRTFTSQEIANGDADETIRQVLLSVAVPGYSQQHSGYALDITEPDTALIDFENTEGFAWLSANNYRNAKQFGFIPSYPEGAEDIGPLPEPWQFVYVGRDLLEQ